MRVEGSSVPGLERVFTEAFTIGRGIQATLHVDSGRVSRIHAEVLLEAGQWVLHDAGSTNGTYCEGERVDELPLVGEVVVRLGRDGPAVHFKVREAIAPRHEETAVTEEVALEDSEARTNAGRTSRITSPERGWTATPDSSSEPVTGSERSPQNGTGEPAKASVSQVSGATSRRKPTAPSGSGR